MTVRGPILWNNSRATFMECVKDALLQNKYQRSIFSLVLYGRHKMKTQLESSVNFYKEFFVL